MKRKLLLFLLFTACCMALSSCGSSRGVTNAETRLQYHFKQWEGTPYRLGGTSRRGVDCSSFVQIIMKETYGVNLPRTTREQLNFGTEIPASAARMGDLVYFRTGRTSYHVGIMMRGDFFMHASTSRGVTIDRLQQAYWRDRVIQFRRVTRP